MQSRMPAVIAEWLVDRTRTARSAMLALCVLSSGLSMFVENVAVVLLGRRTKVLPAIAGRCRGRGIPRGAACPEACYALLRGRAARDVPPHGARGRVRRPHADSASVLPFGKTPASLPAPARVSAVRRNVPLRSLAAGAASARGGKKPPAGRFCLLVFGRVSPSARREDIADWQKCPACDFSHPPPIRAQNAPAFCLGK